MQQKQRGIKASAAMAWRLWAKRNLSATYWSLRMTDTRQASGSHTGCPQEDDTAVLQMSGDRSSSWESNKPNELPGRVCTEERLCPDAPHVRRLSTHGAWTCPLQQAAPRCSHVSDPAQHWARQTTLQTPQLSIYITDTRFQSVWNGTLSPSAFPFSFNQSLICALILCLKIKNPER